VAVVAVGRRGDAGRPFIGELRRWRCGRGRRAALSGDNVWGGGEALCRRQRGGRVRRWDTALQPRPGGDQRRRRCAEVAAAVQRQRQSHAGTRRSRAAGSGERWRGPVRRARCRVRACVSVHGRAEGGARGLGKRGGGERLARERGRRGGELGKPGRAACGKRGVGPGCARQGKRERGRGKKKIEKEKEREKRDRERAGFAP
jgi:hypothetical protein